MRIRVLGCHGSDALINHSAGLHCCRSIGFLVNDSLMVDGGTISSALHLEAQQGIRYVVLTHAHFDHLKELPALADNLITCATSPVTVVGTQEVIDDIKIHIFNNRIFPDFFSLPDPQHPTFTSQVMEEGWEIHLGDLGVIPIRVNHVVPTVGLIFRAHHIACAFSGDTHQTEEIWKRAAAEPNLKAVFIETSLPNEMRELALASKHLTPALLLQEFQKIGKPDLLLYVYHLKPQFRNKIISQLNELRIPNLHILIEGQEINLT